MNMTRKFLVKGMLQMIMWMTWDNFIIMTSPIFFVLRLQSLHTYIYPSYKKTTTVIKIRKLSYVVVFLHILGRCDTWGTTKTLYHR